MTHYLSTWDYQYGTYEGGCSARLSAIALTPVRCRALPALPPDGREAVGTDFPDGALRNEPDEPRVPALAARTAFARQHRAAQSAHGPGVCGATPSCCCSAGLARKLTNTLLDARSTPRVSLHSHPAHLHTRSGHVSPCCCFLRGSPKHFIARTGSQSRRPPGGSRRGPAAPQPAARRPQGAPRRPRAARCRAPSPSPPPPPPPAAVPGHSPAPPATSVPVPVPAEAGQEAGCPPEVGPGRGASGSDTPAPAPGRPWRSGADQR